MIKAWGERIVRALIPCVPKHHRAHLVKIVEDMGKTLSAHPGSCVPAKLSRGRMPTMHLFGTNSRRPFRADLVLATVYGVRFSKQKSKAKKTIFFL